jgi:hypothetical protein
MKNYVIFTYKVSVKIFRTHEKSLVHHTLPFIKLAAY